MAIVAGIKKYSINTKIYTSSTNYFYFYLKKNKNKKATSPGVYTGKRVAASSPGDTTIETFFFLLSSRVAL